MTREQKQMVTDHLHIAKSLAARRAGCTGLPYEDLYQECCRLLCVAALHYDGHTASFPTYAQTVLRNGLFTYCTKAAKAAGNEILVDDESFETSISLTGTVRTPSAVSNSATCSTRRSSGIPAPRTGASVPFSLKRRGIRSRRYRKCCTSGAISWGR